MTWTLGPTLPLLAVCPEGSHVQLSELLQYPNSHTGQTDTRSLLITNF